MSAPGAAPAAWSRPGRVAAWLLGAAALVLVAAEWRAIEPALRGAALRLYAVGTSFNAVVAEPLNRLRLSTTVPLLAPLLLGLMAATAPCQLSTGSAALAYVGRDGEPGGAVRRATAYLLAKVVFYAVAGAVVMYVVGGDVRAPGDFFTGVRRVLGPATLLAGLVMLRVIRPRFELGGRASARLRELAGARGGTLGAFGLGLAFSLAFCPTLFFLFFAITVPLALSSPLGFAYPAVFAVGMTLPLLGVAWLVSGAREGAAGPDAGGAYLRGLRRWNLVAAPVAGAVFVLAGLYDTVVYWFV